MSGYQPPKNIIVMTSVLGNAKDQPRIKALLEIPAHRRGLSCEPLWESPDLTDALWKSGCEPHCGERCSKDADCPLNPLGSIQWVIVGCDSSKKRKGWEHYEENALSIIQQCQSAGVKVWHKQMPVDDKVCGDSAKFPDHMRQREFPSI